MSPGCRIISLHYWMNNRRSQKDRPTKARLRCYSSMNYQEYQDFFGTPPKMPQAPNCKPQDDPLEIPFLSLENEVTQESQCPRSGSDFRLQYTIEIIPEVDSSEANSIGFPSPHGKKDFFHFNSQKRIPSDRDDSVQLTANRGRRRRPRSYSENSPFMTKLRIIDFLSYPKNNQQDQGKIRKVLKFQ